MQASRQRRPRHTPTMMPVTECMSSESGGERGQHRSRTEGQGLIEEGGLWLLQETTELSFTLWRLTFFFSWTKDCIQKATSPTFIFYFETGSHSIVQAGWP